MSIIYKVQGKIKQLLPVQVKRAFAGIIDVFDDRKCVREEDCLILQCDGGISSQIYQYVWGQILIDMGYKVKYDISFFEKCGRDTLGRKNRFFLLDNMCDLERFQIAPNYLIRHYKFRFLNTENQPPNTDWMYLEREWKEPLYLGNYYKCKPENFINNINKHIKLKQPDEVLSKENLSLYYKIIKDESVGVHIRRGDMAADTDRWKAPTINYFVKALEIKEFAGKPYYLFSDDIEWVKNNIISVLPSGVNYTMINSGDTEAHQDLYLLAACKYQVASQGSFGIVAYVLNNNSEKLLVFPSDSRAEIFQRLKNENVIVFDRNGNRY